MKKSVGIVGGGIAGMSAAYELAKKGYQVSVFERDEMLGGLAGSFRIEGEYLEKFYHHIFVTDTQIISYLKELGLEERLLWLSSRVGVYYANSIYRFTSPRDLLQFSPLTLWDRIRLGLGTLYIRGIKDWKRLDSLTVREFVTKYMGENVYRVVWQPLFQSKFGKHADQVSAAWLWSKLNIRGPKNKRLKEVLGYLDGGFGLMFDELEKRVLSMGGKIYKNAPAEKIAVVDGKLESVTVNGTVHRFDRLICAVPIPIFLNLTSGLPGDYRQRLAQIEYQNSVCLILKLRKPLSDTYWLNINDINVPFVGVIEHTNFHAKDAYGNYHIAYISKYTNREDPLFAMNKDELLNVYFPHLKKIFPKLERDWIIDSSLWRENYTQAITTVNYAARVPGYKTPVKNLYLVTMAQVFPEDRGMNYGIKTAQQLVDQILAEQE